MGRTVAGTTVSGDGGLIPGRHDNGVSLSLRRQLYPTIPMTGRTRSSSEVAEP